MNRYTIPLIAASWGIDSGKFWEAPTLTELTDELLLHWVRNYDIPILKEKPFKGGDFVVRENDPNSDGTASEKLIVASLISVDEMCEILANIRAAVIMLYCLGKKDYANIEKFLKIDNETGNPMLDIPFATVDWGDEKNDESLISKFNSYLKCFPSHEGRLDKAELFKEINDVKLLLACLVLEKLINEGLNKFGSVEQVKLLYNYPSLEQVDLDYNRRSDEFEFDFAERVRIESPIAEIWSSIAFRVTRDKRGWPFYQCENKPCSGWIFKHVGRGAPAKICDKCRMEDLKSNGRVRKHREKKKKEKGDKT